MIIGNIHNKSLKMAVRKTPEQQLETLTKKRAQLDAKIQNKKAVVRKKSRREDTRRKIIAGAIALEAASRDKKFKAHFDGLLQEHVTRPEDRKLFDL